MASNRNKYIKINMNIHKILPRILLAGIFLFLYFRVSDSSPATAQGVETLKSKNNNLIGNNTDWSLLQTDQVIIKYKDTLIGNNLFDPASAKQIQRINNAAGVSLIYLREMSGHAHVLRLPSRMSSDAVQVIIQRLIKLPEVEYAEPDVIMQHTLTPDDPYFSSQWHYFAPTTGNYGINAPAAWDMRTGSSSIVIAVVDTGITNHIEFVGRTVPGYDFISNINMANDGDGRDSDPSDPGDWVAKNECYPGSSKEDSSWHGTHTAGTIGAASNNGIGVAGINWNSKILPVRVLGKCGGYTSDVIDGMRWAAGLTVTGVPTNTNPAKVINISLGGTGLCGTLYQTAIDAITAAGTTVVAAAGNSNVDASNFSPANCNGVITVAATNRNGDKASYSNYGSTVEISAPGGEQSYKNDPNGILSTLNTGTTIPVADTYIYYQGTSMAAPHVSGVASLLYSLDPLLTPNQVLQYLQNTATSFPGGSTCTTSTCGSGIVNAGAAMASVLPTAVDLISFTATSGIDGISLVWETASEVNNLGFNLYRATSLDGKQVKINQHLIPIDMASGSLEGASYEYLDDTVNSGGQYYYWLEDTDLSGRSKGLHGPTQARAQWKLFLPILLGGE